MIAGVAANRWCDAAQPLRAGCRPATVPESRSGLADSGFSKNQSCVLVLLGCEPLVTDLFPQRPSEMGEILAIKNFRRALADVVHEPRPPVTAAVVPDRGHVGHEL